jgi:hypothetical protein
VGCLHSQTILYALGGNTMKLRFSWSKPLFLILAMWCFSIVGQIWKIGFGKQIMDWPFTNLPGFDITVIFMEILIICIVFGVLGLVLGIIWRESRSDLFWGSLLIVINFLSAVMWHSWELGNCNLITAEIFVTAIMFINLTIAECLVPENIDSLAN